MYKQKPEKPSKTMKNWRRKIWKYTKRTLGNWKRVHPP